MIPKISIIVPVYNAEKYLRRCIESILVQSHQKIEIILVNDGSTDDSGSICNDYKEKYNNFKVLHHSHKSGGAGSPRNSGLSIASGDYISFVDSDDWIHPEMMKTLLTGLQKNKTDIAECELIETNNYFLKSLDKFNFENFIVEDRLIALKRIINTSRFSVCVRLYKYSIIREMKFPENVISEDVYFTLKVFNEIKKLARIEVPLYYYFFTPNSVTRKCYSLKYLETLKSGLFLQESILNDENDKELLIAVQDFILREIMYHYKMLNYYSNIDPKYLERKKLKNLIGQNCFNSKIKDPFLKLANMLSVRSFEVIINLNKLRHRIFRTNQYS